jgi:hypothetical protein
MPFHLVIVAGGIGSRLAPLTNYIPKFLVNIGKETGFVKMIQYWSQYNPETITVIVHSQYKDLVQSYFDLYFGPNVLSIIEGRYQLINPPFIVKTVDEANGSAHAIMSTCAEHLQKKSVIFSWCDVIPVGDIDIQKMLNYPVAAFTNYDYPNRYDLIKTPKTTGLVVSKSSIYVPAIRYDNRGGIFGLYFVKSFEAKPYTNGQDFVELLQCYSKDGEVYRIKMSSIIDFGDMPKLERVRSSADTARSFNAVQMHGDLVLKTALTPQGEGLIAKEIDWYDTLDEYNSDVSRPKHWASNDRVSFIMQKVQGIPLWELWQTLDEDGRVMVLTRVFDELAKLHCHQKLVHKSVFDRDVKIEAYDKLISRYEEIAPVINAFGPVQCVEINGKLHRLNELDPKVTISRLYEALCIEYKNEQFQHLIHGDSQMSNTIINPDTLEITFIDPRGYFGKTQTFGCKDYDIAKMLYSLDGYDLFNYSKNFYIKYNGLNLSTKEWVVSFDMPKPNIDGCDEVIYQRTSRVHKLWLAVIWIGLAQYIKNDPVKMMAVHYYGLTMAEQLLNAS